MTANAWHRRAFLVFDTETTGVDVNADRIVTATIARIDPGNPAERLYRCGSCVHRVSLNHHGEYWPKCDLSTITHGQASDVRAWWPACPRWEQS